jgi:predicted AAA+ superfamily ATPase
MSVGNESVGSLVGELGNWVQAEKFLGREEELAELKGLLDRGSHVLITAPRRMGKTSLMRECARRLRRHYELSHDPV